VLDRHANAKGFRGRAIVSFMNVLPENSSLVAAVRRAEKCLENAIGPFAAAFHRAWRRRVPAIKEPFDA
jgi:hypothetical protein